MHWQGTGRIWGVTADIIINLARRLPPGWYQAGDGVTMPPDAARRGRAGAGSSPRSAPMR